MTTTDHSQTAIGGAAESRQQFVQQNAILLVFIAFIVVATLASNGRFIQPSNLSVILFQASVIGVLALGQTLVMLVAGIDLSIVAVAILAAIVMGAGGSMRQQEMNLGGFLPFIGFLPSIALAMVGSAVIGAINGIVVVKLRIPAFITTLAMSLALSGVAMLTTGGTPVHYPDSFFSEFGRAKIAGLSLTVYVFIVLAAVLGLFLAQDQDRRDDLRHRRQPAGGAVVGHSGR